jgi:hypothetical protein
MPVLEEIARPLRRARRNRGRVLCIREINSQFYMPEQAIFYPFLSGITMKDWTAATWHRGVTRSPTRPGDEQRKHQKYPSSRVRRRTARQRITTVTSTCESLLADRQERRRRFGGERQNNRIDIVIDWSSFNCRESGSLNHGDLGVSTKSRA